MKKYEQESSLKSASISNLLRRVNSSQTPELKLHIPISPVSSNMPAFLNSRSIKLEPIITTPVQPRKKPDITLLSIENVTKIESRSNPRTLSVKKSFVRAEHEKEPAFSANKRRTLKNYKH